MLLSQIRFPELVDKITPGSIVVFIVFLRQLHPEQLHSPVPVDAIAARVMFSAQRDDVTPHICRFALVTKKNMVALCVR